MGGIWTERPSLPTSVDLRFVRRSIVSSPVYPEPGMELIALAAIPERVQRIIDHLTLYGRGLESHEVQREILRINGAIEAIRAEHAKA